MNCLLMLLQRIVNLLRLDRTQYINCIFICTIKRQLVWHSVASANKSGLGVVIVFVINQLVLWKLYEWVHAICGVCKE